jgi:LacI family transcriptional regulator
VAATIKDVAKAAGVHVSTVSRTFSAPHLVNPHTRVRVLATAEQLGYRPNRAARALVTGRTHNMGLIVADIANPFFPPLIKAADGQARERDYHVFVADTDEDPLVEEELVQTLAKQVDGVLLCSPRMSGALIDQLRRNVPLVLINRVVDGLPAVVMDVAQGARAAIGHLVELGHRSIALLCGPPGSWTNRQIRRSAATMAAEAGVDLVMLGPNPPTELAGIAAAEQVRRTGVTGVLTYNDLMGIGLLEGLESIGVSVPGDISVVGIDDIALSRFIRPKLTTVVMPAAAAGRAAVDMLLQQNDGLVTLPTRLVIRESSGPGPHRRPDRPLSAAAAPARGRGATSLHVKE